MKVIDTKIPDLKIIEPQVFGDERGFFLETFQKKKYLDCLGITDDFVQDNIENSEKNTDKDLVDTHVDENKIEESKKSQVEII